MVRIGPLGSSMSPCASSSPPRFPPIVSLLLSSSSTPCAPFVPVLKLLRSSLGARYLVSQLGFPAASRGRNCSGRNTHLDTDLSTRILLSFLISYIVGSFLPSKSTLGKVRSRLLTYLTQPDSHVKPSPHFPRVWRGKSYLPAPYGST